VCKKVSHSTLEEHTPLLLFFGYQHGQTSPLMRRWMTHLAMAPLFVNLDFFNRTFCMNDKLRQLAGMRRSGSAINRIGIRRRVLLNAGIERYPQFPHYNRYF